MYPEISLRSCSAGCDQIIQAGCATVWPADESNPLRFHALKITPEIVCIQEQKHSPAGLITTTPSHAAPHFPYSATGGRFLHGVRLDSSH